jgi:triosephosphate isomerase
MTRRKLIAGNWKMNTSLDEALKLARAITAYDNDAPSNVELAVCPPFPWLVPVRDLFAGSNIALGAQNCSHLPNGAVTGEVSAQMLTGLCRFVIVGHSERRNLFGESDKVVRLKVDATLDVGLTPIICVGESLDIRQQGGAAKYVIDQLSAVLDGRSPGEIRSCVIAYEPVWAIGSGVAASATDAEEMARTIRETIDSLASGTGDDVRILYGGSVTAANSIETLTQENVDGALVGGASLKSDTFLEIARSVSG